MNTTNKQKILGGKRIEGHINVANTGIRSICLFPNGCSNFMTPASPPVKKKKKIILRRWKWCTTTFIYIMTLLGPRVTLAINLWKLTGAFTIKDIRCRPSGVAIVNHFLAQTDSQGISNLKYVQLKVG